MITWPIFVALFLACFAVYFSIKQDSKNEREDQELSPESKIAEIEKRKRRIEKEMGNS